MRADEAIRGLQNDQRSSHRRYPEFSLVSLCGDQLSFRARAATFLIDGPMQNVICSGWLLKTGGAGHNYKNTKTRWFELRVRYNPHFSEDRTQFSALALLLA